MQEVYLERVAGLSHQVSHARLSYTMNELAYCFEIDLSHFRHYGSDTFTFYSRLPFVRILQLVSPSIFASSDSSLAV